MWDLWLLQWHWDSFFAVYSSFHPISIILRTFHSYSLITNTIYSQQLTALLSNMHFYSAVCQDVFMLTACTFSESVMLVPDSCYYV